MVLIYTYNVLNSRYRWNNFLLYLCVYCFVFVAAVFVSTEEWNMTLSANLGTEATIMCMLLSDFLPAWRGPPLSGNVSSIYTYEGRAEFNPDLGQEKMSRMSWATNNRDLRLKSVTFDDTGIYECALRGSSWKVKLEVRGRLWFTKYSNEHTPVCFRDARSVSAYHYNRS